MTRASNLLWWVATAPFRLAWNLFLLPFRIVVAPFRLSRSRISVQLILSNTLVVLLTVVILEAAAVGLLGLISLGRFAADNPDALLASQSSTVAVGLGSGPAADALTTLDSDPTSPGARVAVSRGLATALGIVGDLPASPEAVVLPEQVGSARVASALVATPDGTVVASTDPGWASVGQHVSQISDPLAQEVAARAIELHGKPTGWGNLYVLDAQNYTTRAAHPILRPGGAMLGIVLLKGQPGALSEGVIAAVLRQVSPSFLVTAVAANVALLGLIAIPALLVSIPVGVWRARVISKRLSRLAEAADAMEQGDLSRRVEVRGEDEISRLSIHFNQVIERLDQADRARKAFIANVSHDLRTPLAIIQGNLEQLMAREAAVPAGPPTGGAVVAEPDRERQALAAIHRETLTLNRLIDDLFTLARLEEAVLPLEATPLALDEIADQAVEGVRAVSWSQRKVTVESLVPRDLPPILADRVRLTQVLANLLHNALRHTPEGGLVVVVAAVVDQMVEVAVRDTGVGIPADELSHVFDRFYQSEHAGRNTDGSGLGLAIVKQLAEAQGGTIAVESTPETGTTFRFTLPLAPSPASRSSTA